MRAHDAYCLIFSRMLPEAEEKTEDKSLILECKYGANCYRKNEEHLRKFRHPSIHPPSTDPLYFSLAKTTVTMTSVAPTTTTKPKVTSPPLTFEASSPVGLIAEPKESVIDISDSSPDSSSQDYFVDLVADDTDRVRSRQGCREIGEFSCQGNWEVLRTC